MTPSSVALPPYDFLLAGGGLAGLSLAWHIQHSPLAGRRMLLIDRDEKIRNDRTWCFWSREAGPFDSLASAQWEQALFAHPARQITIPLAPYRYRMIRGIDFYQSLTRELAQYPNIEFRYGEITGLHEEGDAAMAEVEGKAFRGKWLFHSLFRAGEFQPDPRRYLYLRQHFLGWEIETGTDAFDPATFTLIDFRTPQRGAMRFFYVLPFSPRRALVEYTLFSQGLLTEAEYKSGLEAYIRNVLGIRSFTITAQETGAIPMTNQPFPRQLGRRILAVGTRGGRVKASTGYAFRRIQKDSAAIVRSLVRHGHPFDIPADPVPYPLLDASMLRMMARRPEEMADLFLRIFGGNPTTRVFRFLDEEAGPLELAMLMATLPVVPMARAFLGIL